MCTIKLKCGVEVYVDSFSFYHTYAGLLAGKKDERMNRRFFNEAHYPDNWGKRKYIKIIPDRDDFVTGLKPFCYSAWLCSKALDDYSFGSYLVVIWLSEAPRNDSIFEIIRKGIENIDWNREAENYDP